MNIKPLQWTQPDPENPNHMGGEDDLLIALGVGGFYSISQLQRISKAPFEGYLLWWVEDPFTFAEFGSVAEAMVAAQADHETRVLRLLEE